MPQPARGKLALVGAGEYLPTMASVDAMLLKQVEGTPQVVVLPTAAVPDGRVVTERWATMGVDYFTQLGAQVEALMLQTREDANDMHLVNKITTANFVYFSGGKPHYLLQTLQDTLAWQAIKGIFSTGGVVAGCSAGAMVLGGITFRYPQVWQTTPALGLVPDLAIVPHFDEIPALIISTLTRLLMKETIVGIDGSTALVWQNGEWTVQGNGGVTIFTAQTSKRYPAGAKVPLTPLTQ
jgi:cyanophycinase